MSTCKHCNQPIIWLTTPAGPRPFDPETAPVNEVPDGDGYLIRRDRVAIPVSDVPPRAVRDNPRVAVKHRCREYSRWRSQQEGGLSSTLDALARTLRGPEQ